VFFLREPFGYFRLAPIPKCDVVPFFCSPFVPLWDVFVPFIFEPVLVGNPGVSTVDWQTYGLCRQVNRANSDTDANEKITALPSRPLLPALIPQSAAHGVLDDSGKHSE